MYKTRILMIFVFFVVVLFGNAFAGPDVDPGKWAITTTTEMAGMPPQSVTHNQCITDNDVVPMSQDASQECQVEDIQVDGDTVSWKITCGGDQGGMTGTGQVTYEGDTMNGEMNMTIAPYGTQVKNTISGRRIGECDSSTSSSSSQSSAPVSSSSDSEVSDDAIGEAIGEDAKEVGEVARDEAKEATKEGVKEGVRDLFEDIFK